jgi:hypothetical protein
LCLRAAAHQRGSHEGARGDGHLALVEAHPRSPVRKESRPSPRGRAWGSACSRPRLGDPA